MKTQNTFSTLFYTRLDRLNKDGAPLMLRITINGQARSTSLHRRVQPSQWNLSTQKVNGKTSEARELNLFIDNVKSKAVNAYTYLRNTGEHVTADLVKDHLLGRASGAHQGIISYYDQYIKELQGLVGISCSYALFQKNRKARNHFCDFLRSRHNCNDIPIGRLTHDHIQGFYAYLMSAKGHCHNSAVKCMGMFKKIVSRAFHSGWIKRDPFYGFSLGCHKVERVHLNQNELQRIIELDLKTPRLSLVRDLFVFSCYTGLAYVDIKNLTFSELVQTSDGTHWIKTRRQKTKVKANVPLLPIPLEIIKRRANQTKNEQDETVFKVNGVGSTSCSLDCSELDPGVYFVRVFSRSETSTVRLLKN